MIVNFKALEEFNAKYPDLEFGTASFIAFNVMFSEDASDEILDKILLDMRQEFYASLEEEGFIKITGEGIRDISLRHLGGELLGLDSTDSLKDLADEMRNLFPPKIRSGGNLVRSNPKDIVDKLKKFFKKHKYTHEQVLRATERYVKQKESENFAYMKQLVYFIEKDGISTLAAECDNLSNGVPDETLKEDRL